MIAAIRRTRAFKITKLLTEIDIRLEKMSLKAFICLLLIASYWIFSIFAFFDLFNKFYLVWPTIFFTALFFFK